MSAAPNFAKALLGSTPSAPPPKRRVGSGRQSILMFSAIYHEPQFRNLNSEKRRMYYHVVEIYITNIYSFSSAPKERTPEQQVSLYILVAIELHTARSFARSREGRQRSTAVSSSEHVERLNT